MLHSLCHIVYVAYFGLKSRGFLVQKWSGNHLNVGGFSANECAVLQKIFKNQRFCIEYPPNIQLYSKIQRFFVEKTRRRKRPRTSISSPMLIARWEISEKEHMIFWRLHFVKDWTDSFFGTFKVKLRRQVDCLPY